MEQTALRPKPLPGDESDPGRASDTFTPPATSGKPGRSAKSAKSPASATSAKGHRPHAARRRGRRLFSLLFGLFCATVLVLSGIGLGTVGATVIGMSKMAEMQRQAGAQGAGLPGGQGPGQGPPGAATEPGKGAGSASGKGSGTAKGTASATTPGAGPDHAPPPKAPPNASPKKTSSGSGSAAVGPQTQRPALGVEAVDAPGGTGALLVGVHQPGPGHAAGLVRGDVLVMFGGTRVTSAADLAKAVAGARPGRNVMLTVRHASGTRQVLSARPGLVT
ncbi:PDZ domain-containing protein [Streptomyces flavofungini]|uniref:PDZ domain-containing protein n=1 Tax=Streptomyces flavofungini TaxID=68200 RepID=A0ABS0X8P2_9ACTN|nr:PDZ domain-containing protein [Streptomyces flavofungini]MBJ3809572.1 PDZ domain-containing protein [Streptomyces flavofungini]GHC55603.1 PDZ domain-containing protein [Streptomyces flavofungini]